MTTKIFCDACGEEMKGREIPLANIELKAGTHVTAIVSIPAAGVDVCRRCVCKAFAARLSDEDITTMYYLKKRERRALVSENVDFTPGASPEEPKAFRDVIKSIYADKLQDFDRSAVVSESSNGEIKSTGDVKLGRGTASDALRNYPAGSKITNRYPTVGQVKAGEKFAKAGTIAEKQEFILDLWRTMHDAA